MNLYDYFTRQEEYSLDTLPPNNYEPYRSLGFYDHQYFKPVIDEEIIRRDINWSRTIFWPDNKDYAAFLSHDVDTLVPASRIEHWRRSVANYKNRNIHHNVRNLIGLFRKEYKRNIFTPWIDLEAQFGFTSTFFVSIFKSSNYHPIDNTYNINDSFYLSQNKKLNFLKFLEGLNSNGWEIGLHSSIMASNEYNLLEEQKLALEDLLNIEIVTNRYHDLAFNLKNTPRLIDCANFRSDCSLGSNKLVGFRNGTSYPHRLLSNNNEYTSFFEIPLSIHDVCLLRTNNMNLSENEAFQVCKLIIDRVRNVKGVVSLSWHPDTIIFKSWFNVYRRVLQYIYETNGWGTNARSIIDWWTKMNFDKELEKKIHNLKQ